MMQHEGVHDSAKLRLRSALMAAWNEGDFSGMDELLHPSYSRRTFRTATGQTAGELRAAVIAVRAAFPDFRMNIGAMVHEDGKVVWEWHLRGTHDGELFNLPPTHRVVEVSGLTMSTFVNGLLFDDLVTSPDQDMLSLQGIIELSSGSPADPRPDASLDLETLKAVHRSFATGVTIVTASLAGEPRGLVLNAFASVSLEPPLILVAVNRATATHEFLFRSDALAINILAGDQQDLAERFSRPIPNKFEGVPWHPGGNRAPLLDGVAASLEAKVQERISARTHTVFVGQVIAAEVHSRPPLVYLGGRFHDGIQLDSGDRQA